MTLGRMRMKEGWDLAKGFFLGLWNFFMAMTGDTGQLDLSIAIKLWAVNINLNSGCLTSSGSAGLQLLRSLLPAPGVGLLPAVPRPPRPRRPAAAAFLMPSWPGPPCEIT
ncbi:uncharacterized protein LOC112894189 [Panicum hallii]|uniref:uncharacterized protein LOC112894189 n=1 Tax=Panicum hallii TaxID=206008 RepID=UPI000DF4DA7F|nr:uncharacterized protein LOC112894189 [Panicum hallii]